MDRREEVEQQDYINEQKEIVKKVIGNQPKEEYIYDLAELFRVFGDSTRVKILFALIESELCVNDISQILNMNQSTISHQLRCLKDAKLVQCRRNGKAIIYSLADEHVRTILNMGMEHVEE